MQVYEVDDQIKIARTIIVSHKNEKIYFFALGPASGIKNRELLCPHSMFNASWFKVNGS
jgi:hypothetical protein